MGLRHQVKRLLNQCVSKARRGNDLKRRKYLPRVESLEPRALLTGFWTQIQTTNPSSGPVAGVQTLMLLSNGVVMAGQDTAPNPGTNFGIAPQQTTWFQLPPTASGTYVNSTWGAQSTMNTPRLYFPTLTLQDGRIFAIGGEFSPTIGFVNAPEIYNPLTNAWTRVPDMPSPVTQIANPPSVPPLSPQPQFGDDPIEILPNGDVLAGWFNGPQTFVYSPTTNSWRQTSGDKLRNDQSDEESWCLLPDGSILSYDIFASDTTQTFHAQRFIPSLDMWVDASNLDPASPAQPLSDVLNFGAELGPMMLLLDGRVIVFGANGHTAYYNSKTDLWSRGPDMPFDTSIPTFPQQLGATDNPGAVLPNGKVLIAMSINQPLFTPPTHIFEFDPSSNVFTDVTPPNFPTGTFNNFNFNDASVFTMLVLPTGQVLVTSLDNSSGQITQGPDFVYTPDGGPRDSWRPTIQSISSNGNGTFTLTGTQLNGMTEGAYYGDDAEMSSNYPLLRMTDKSGNIVYGRTFNWSSTGVQTGNKIVSTKFTLPGGSTRLTDFSNFTVVANGIPSLPFQFFPTAPQNVSGIKFNDLHGALTTDPADGIREADEPGISHVVIFVDINNDGKLSIQEPSAVTDNFGRYTIKNVPPGNYVVRELAQPGGVQTRPGPLGIDLAGLTPVANSYTVQVLDRAVTGLDFGNTVSDDFGDAPDTYGTTLAANGARAGILPGFHLGLLEDSEPDGLPNVTATGDDAAGVQDDDGISFLTGMTPGGTATIQAIVSTGGFSPGKLQGWVDFNQNGRFDANEKVISNVILGPGLHTLSFSVPAGAKVNNTYARFRYGYEPDLGPTGPSIAGDVEDYQVAVLPSVPIAVPDEFGLPPNLIKQGSKNVVLDVLANDVRTARGLPTIVESDFPKTLPSGSTVSVGPFDPVLGRKVLLYTPSTTTAAPFDDVFTYRVTDGFSISAPGPVTVHVALGNPIALDDTFTLDSSNPAIDDPNNGIRVSLAVLLNDHFSAPDTHITDVVNITAVSPQTVMTIDAADPTKLDFAASSSFHGTEVFQYTIDDSDPNTAPATAFVTMQVVDGGVAASASQLASALYLAELDVQLISPVTGQPTNQLIVDQGDTFTIRVISHDLRPGGSAANRGVEAAYLDLLLPLIQLANGSKADLAQPISITYDPRYTIANQFGQLDHPAAGQIDEAGGAHDSTGGGVGTGDVTVFNVLMRAAHSTGGQPAQIIADPADGVLIAGNPPDFNSQATDVVVKNDPAAPNDPTTVFHELNDFPITDPQIFKTFFRQSGDLTILGSGEGEFVNHVNRFDVNQDTRVSPMDAMLVINDLNSEGARPLMSGAASLMARPAMIDVNMDGNLTPGDALAVVNYLNSATSFLASPGGGEGESGPSSVPSGPTTSRGVTPLDAPEAPVARSGSASQTPSGAVLLTTTATPATDDSSTPDAASGSTTSDNGQSTTTKVDAAAADDLFAGLAAAREQLNRRFNRRR